MGESAPPGARTMKRAVTRCEALRSLCWGQVTAQVLGTQRWNCAAPAVICPSCGFLTHLLTVAHKAHAKAPVTSSPPHSCPYPARP